LIPPLFLGAIGVFWGHIAAQALRGSEEGRDWNDYYRDFKVMSIYSSYFLAAIILFLGWFSEKEKSFLWRVNVSSTVAY